MPVEPNGIQVRFVLGLWVGLVASMYLLYYVQLGRVGIASLAIRICGVTCTEIKSVLTMVFAPVCAFFLFSAAFLSRFCVWTLGWEKVESR